MAVQLTNEDKAALEASIQKIATDHGTDEVPALLDLIRSMKDKYPKFVTSGDRVHSYIHYVVSNSMKQLANGLRSGQKFFPLLNTIINEFAVPPKYLLTTMSEHLDANQAKNKTVRPSIYRNRVALVMSLLHSPQVTEIYKDDNASVLGEVVRELVNVPHEYKLDKLCMDGLRLLKIPKSVYGAMFSTVLRPFIERLPMSPDLLMLVLHLRKLYPAFNPAESNPNFKHNNLLHQSNLDIIHPILKSEVGSHITELPEVWSAVCSEAVSRDERGAADIARVWKLCTDLDKPNISRLVLLRLMESAYFTSVLSHSAATKLLADLTSTSEGISQLARQIELTPIIAIRLLGSSEKADKVLQALSQPALVHLCKTAMKEFTNPSHVDSELLESHRTSCSVIIFKAAHNVEDKAFVANVLKFLFLHGCFEVTKHNSVIPETLTSIPKPTISLESREPCSRSFLRLLAHVVKQATLETVDDKFVAFEACVPKLTSPIIDYYTALTKNKVVLAEPLDEKAVQCINGALKHIKTASKDPKNAALQELIKMAIFQIIIEDSNGATELLGDLTAAYEQLFVTKSEDLSEVYNLLMDTIIGQQSRDPTVLGGVPSQVMKVFALDVSSDSFLLLLNILNEDAEEDGHSDEEDEDDDEEKEGQRFNKSEVQPGGESGDEDEDDDETIQEGAAEPSFSTVQLDQDETFEDPTEKEVEAMKKQFALIKQTMASVSIQEGLMLLVETYLRVRLQEKKLQLVLVEPLLDSVQSLAGLSIAKKLNEILVSAVKTEAIDFKSTPLKERKEMLDRLLDRVINSKGHSSLKAMTVVFWALFDSVTENSNPKAVQERVQNIVKAVTTSLTNAQSDIGIDLLFSIMVKHPNSLATTFGLLADSPSSVLALITKDNTGKILTQAAPHISQLILKHLKLKKIHPTIFETIAQLFKRVQNFTSYEEAKKLVNTDEILSLLENLKNAKLKRPVAKVKRLLVVDEKKRKADQKANKATRNKKRRLEKQEQTTAPEDKQDGDAETAAPSESQTTSRPKGEKPQNGKKRKIAATATSEKKKKANKNKKTKDGPDAQEEDDEELLKAYNKL